MSAADCIYSISRGMDANESKVICHLHNSAGKTIHLPIRVLSDSAESAIIVTVHDGRLYALKNAIYVVTLYEIVSPTLAKVISTYGDGAFHVVSYIYSGGLPTYVEPHLFACKHTDDNYVPSIVSVVWSSPTPTLVSTPFIAKPQGTISFLQYIACDDQRIALYLNLYSDIQNNAEIGSNFIVIPAKVRICSISYMQIRPPQIRHIYAVNGMVYINVMYHMVRIDIASGAIDVVYDNFHRLVTSVAYGPFIISVCGVDTILVIRITDTRTGDKYDVGQAGLYDGSYDQRTLMIAPQLRIFDDSVTYEHIQ